MKKTAIILSLFSLSMFSCDKKSNWNCSCSINGGPYSDFMIQETKPDDATDKCNERKAVHQAVVGVNTVDCNLIDLGL